MGHFKGKKEMGHFYIGMHIHASDLSLSQPFWGILATLVYNECYRFDADVFLDLFLFEKTISFTCYSS